MSNQPETGPERRQKKDRRNRPTPMLSRYSLWGGRRESARRRDDRRGGYYVDRYGPALLFLFAIVILLNALDAFLALYILHAMDGIENVLTRVIREMGGETFIMAAFIVGSLCALFLFIHKNFPIARLAIGAVILFQIVTISTQLIIILFFHAT
ncbi:MAG: hypothetical protein GTN74_15700 [Proteobacteria bacterium]|nr:hypothetical protein [Pseudomonadota bacterium]NIS72062.1 hypothetical protein [Pseudomonadota bacterium]